MRRNTGSLAFRLCLVICVFNLIFAGTAFADAKFQGLGFPRLPNVPSSESFVWNDLPSTISGDGQTVYGIKASSVDGGYWSDWQMVSWTPDGKVEPVPGQPTTSHRVKPYGASYDRAVVAGQLYWPDGGFMDADGVQISLQTFLTHPWHAE